MSEWWLWDSVPRAIALGFCTGNCCPHEEEYLEKSKECCDSLSVMNNFKSCNPTIIYAHVCHFAFICYVFGRWRGTGVTSPHSQKNLVTFVLHILLSRLLIEHNFILNVKQMLHECLNLRDIIKDSIIYSKIIKDSIYKKLFLNP